MQLKIKKAKKLKSLSKEKMSWDGI